MTRAEFDEQTKKVLFRIEEILNCSIHRSKDITKEAAGDIGFYVGSAYRVTSDFLSTLRTEFFPEKGESE